VVEKALNRKVREENPRRPQRNRAWRPHLLCVLCEALCVLCG